MLLKKLLRDMGRNKMQFVSIFLMSLLGMFVLAGITSDWIGIQKTADEFYRETNLASVWLYDSDFTEEDADAALEVDGVTGVSRRLTVDVMGDYASTPSIKLHLVDNVNMSGFHLVDGAPFQSSADKIWLDLRFAQATDLAVGDDFSFTFHGMSITKEIAGLVYGSEYVYYSGGGDLIPDFSKVGYAYASIKAYPLPGDIPYNEMMLTTGRTDWVQLEKELSDAVPGSFAVFLSRDDVASVTMLETEIEQHRVMGTIFPTVFIAVTLLIILTTMTRLVNAQRLQVGTLKALGFKKRRIVWHYVSYAFFLSLAGSVLGAMVGPLILPYLFYYSLQNFYTLPQWVHAYSDNTYVFTMLFVLACSGASWFAARKIMRDTPAETLRPGKPRLSKSGRLENTKLWARLKFGTQWNLRDTIRNKVRSLMAVVGVLACTALLICAFGMGDTFDYMKEWQYEDVSVFESQISISDTATAQQIDDMTDKVAGEQTMIAAAELRVKNLKKSAELTVMGGESMINVTDIEHNYVDVPKNGIAISWQISEELGIGEGDFVEFHLYGDKQWTYLQVSLVFLMPLNEGVILPRAAFENLGYTFAPNIILSPKTLSAGELDGASGVWSKADLASSWEELTGSMMIMSYVLILAAGVLAVVVLYNLGLLSFIERHRELATLKVVGFKSKQITNLLLSQNLMLSIVGVAIGVPAGHWLLYVMMDTAGSGFELMTYVTPVSVFISIAITVLLSVGVTWMFSRKIRGINMAESLKAVE